MALHREVPSSCPRSGRAGSCPGSCSPTYIYIYIYIDIYTHVYVCICRCHRFAEVMRGLFVYNPKWILKNEERASGNHCS